MRGREFCWGLSLRDCGCGQAKGCGDEAEQANGPWLEVVGRGSLGVTVVVPGGNRGMGLECLQAGVVVPGGLHTRGSQRHSSRLLHVM